MALIDIVGAFFRGAFRGMAVQAQHGRAAVHADQAQQEQEEIRLVNLAMSQGPQRQPPTQAMQQAFVASKPYNAYLREFDVALPRNAKIWLAGRHNFQDEISDCVNRQEYKKAVMWTVIGRPSF